MTWENRRARRRVVDDLLRRAEDRHGESPTASPVPSIDDIPGGELLAGPDGVWLALQDRWHSLLTARLAFTLDAAEELAGRDRLDAAAAAWRGLAAEQPTLRRLLDTIDADTSEARAAAHREARLLANAAGLAGTGEAPDRLHAVGTALRELIGHNPVAHSGHRIEVRDLRAAVAARA